MKRLTITVLVAGLFAGSLFASENNTMMGMDKEKCMAFINCGHMCICETCTQRVDKCPICRTQGSIIKIYK